MRSEKLLIPDFQNQVLSILEETKTEHDKIRSVLELSQEIRREGYAEFSFQDAVETSQTFCNLIDNMNYKTYEISMDDEDAAWYGLGCIYTDVAGFTAKNFLAKPKRWETNPHHDTTHPYDLLERAICCFSQGIGFQLAQHYTWYCKQCDRDASDRDQLSIKIGEELKQSARKMLEEGTFRLARELALWDLSHGKDPRREQEVHRESTFCNEACGSIFFLSLLALLVALIMIEGE